MANDPDREEKSPGSSPRPAQRKPETPKVFECKLCGKVFDSDEEHPSCPECDSNDVERMG